MNVWTETSGDIQSRQQMVQHQLRQRGISDESVLRVMEELPRQFFIPKNARSFAYDDAPVPIGYEQTISQPYIVALMTEKLAVSAQDEVLEIGTGSGYQTAILSRLCRKVYSIERIEALARFGRDNVEQTGVDNVSFCIGDGTLGWPEERQFDRILIAAAGSDVPLAVWQQLKEGGKLVMPVSDERDQRLLLIEKNQGKRKESLLCYCRFVKLIRGA